jgi:hypothetical protein
MTTDLGAVLSGIGILLTGIGVIFAVKQLSAAYEQLKAANVQLVMARRIAGGDFLFHLDEMFRYHDKFHRQLRSGGDWCQADHPNEEIGPSTSEEWADVEGYMGLFERIKVLDEDEIIDLERIKRLYGYRMSNIVDNNRIRAEKLEKRPKGWRDLIELARSLKIYPIQPAARYEHSP